MRLRLAGISTFLMMLWMTERPFLQISSTRTFNLSEIQVRMSADVDIVYHVLAHFDVPGDPANLYSQEYMNQIRQAKVDLETEPTLLDQNRLQMETAYRQNPGLRFLNLALFVADDYSTFKQALIRINDQPPPGKPGEVRETLEERKVRESRSGLVFGNARRLVPLFQRRFPEPAERQFIQLFAQCMDTEYTQFYRVYRETRMELDQQGFETFMKYWKSDGFDILKPWAAQSGVNLFTIYLSQVFKNNGRGVPVTEDRQIKLNIVAPLPEKREQAVVSLLIILHETSHRLTDEIVEASLPGRVTDLNRIRENAVFSANHLYLKSRFPGLLPGYLKFFLNLPADKQVELNLLEDQFRKSYPVSSDVQVRLEQLVKGLK